jgi:hypothetical protein
MAELNVSVRQPDVHDIPGVTINVKDNITLALYTCLRLADRYLMKKNSVWVLFTNGVSRVIINRLSFLLTFPKVINQLYAEKTKLCER